MWDPGQYQRYADQRARPFFDLLARVSAADPRSTTGSDPMQRVEPQSTIAWSRKKLPARSAA